MATSESISQPPAAPPRNVGLLVRLATIGVLLALIAGLLLYAGGWFTPHTLTPAAFVNTLEQVEGVHPGFRRNHAKGIDVTGYFDRNGQGQAISKSLVFQPGRVPIVGRIAFNGGNPDVADAPQTVRSLAILFRLPDGEEWRTAMVNILVFLAKTPQAFHDFLLASAPDPATGNPRPETMNAFLAGHPETVAAMKMIGSHPFSSGFGDSPYYGVNAFRFIGASGESVPVRWWVEPEQTFAPVTSGATAKNYLFDALIAQVHEKPLRWRLLLTVGQPGDPTADPSAPWPADRKQIDAGTLTVDSIQSEDTSPTRDIVFDPLAKNPAQFALLSRLLHWLMAALLLAMLFIGVSMVASLADYHMLVTIHRPLGILILFLAAIRLATRMFTTLPAFPPTMSPPERFVAKASEILMYTLFFALPLIGWGMLSAGHYPIEMFGAVYLPAILPARPELYAVLREAHTLLAYLLFLAVLAHFAAILFHTLILRDGLLNRMLPWSVRAAEEE